MKIPESFKAKVKKEDLEKLLSRKSYTLIDIEHGVKNEREDCLHFDESFEILKDKGYDRHLMPRECFSLLIDYFEERKKDPVLAGKMLQSYGEWFDMAVQVWKDRLFCYTMPRNIKWDKATYEYFIDGPDLDFKAVTCFDISGFPNGEFVKLESFSDSFVKFFYGRKFKELPEEIKKSTPKFFLPNPSYACVRPIGRGFGNKFCIGTFSDDASRGIRKKKVYK